mmetsp:Transcript_33936/g.70051  ORF Transcript_33936/g.70051 Transcript_33936/m.70051 type:complete len:312 (-) Transcript_33936:107-1042(-)|eukprot:CAMPEP_0181323008 /NCGR_PEP_ID=MMETSP1101-20121128/19542_1 /TAXON_ID=46948 /ORGANISM="Rhodomonas abbreviata, Strain Caron Lab Isolate" /LENGTH=311 /DNA_ID=CAMNT_0023430979 /DNA_START=67 /DNA_END=1002 /DNA_ORIENTATION=+
MSNKVNSQGNSLFDDAIGFVNSILPSPISEALSPRQPVPEKCVLPPSTVKTLSPRQLVPEKSEKRSGRNVPITVIQALSTPVVEALPNIEVERSMQSAGKYANNVPITAPQQGRLPVSSYSLPQPMPGATQQRHTVSLQNSFYKSLALPPERMDPTPLIRPPSPKHDESSNPTQEVENIHEAPPQSATLELDTTHESVPQQPASCPTIKQVFGGLEARSSSFPQTRDSHGTETTYGAPANVHASFQLWDSEEYTDVMPADSSEPQGTDREKLPGSEEIMSFEDRKRAFKRSQSVDTKMSYKVCSWRHILVR